MAKALTEGMKPSITSDRIAWASFWIRYSESAVPVVSWYESESRCSWRKIRSRKSTTSRSPATAVRYRVASACT